MLLEGSSILAQAGPKSRKAVNVADWKPTPNLVPECGRATQNRNVLRLARRKNETVPGKTGAGTMSVRRITTWTWKHMDLETHGPGNTWT
jgi:hypothetical protein